MPGAGGIDKYPSKRAWDFMVGTLNGPILFTDYMIEKGWSSTDFKVYEFPRYTHWGYTTMIVHYLGPLTTAMDEVD